MSKVTDIGVFVIGTISIICVNALAFVFDGQWINTAIALDSMFVGALITKFLTKSY
jgi:hypothetical protein